MAAEVNNSEAFELLNYIDSMGSRMNTLQSSASHISKQLDRSMIGLKSKREELAFELKDLKNDMFELKRDIRSVQKSIIEMINGLKLSVKADEFSRFKKRIDLWAPETFVTRHEVDKVLDEL
jgi:hypothetical protein